MASSDSVQAGANHDRWYDRLLLVTMALACAVALSKSHADPDIWGHFQYGRDALQHGLPTTATYTYTAIGRRWINHEVISEYALAVALPVMGQSVVLTCKCLLGLSMLGLMYRLGKRRGAELVPTGLALLLVSACLMHFWCLRPQLLSYLLFAAMIALLEATLGPDARAAGAGRPAASPNAAPLADRGRLIWLGALLPLFVVWTNSHGGFVAGYCVLGTYFAGRSCQWLVSGRHHSVRSALLLGALLLGVGLATLINPYGWDLHRWLLASLRSPRPEIIEWRPPELISLAWLPWWTLVAAFVAAAIGTRKHRDPVHFLLLGLTLWQACMHRRHIPFFAILFGFWMPIHMTSVWTRLTARSRSPSRLGARTRWQRWSPVTALALTSILMACYLVSQFRQIRVQRDGYPVAAFQFMADHRLDGRLVVQFKWAQYAIAAFAAERPDMPRIDVAFDGRFRTCYPQHVVDMYFDFANGRGADGTRYRSPDSPTVEPARILEYGRPNLVLIDRRRAHPTQVMQSHRADWVLLYQDGVAQLWGRRAIYDDSADHRYIAREDRVITNRPQSGLAQWPALPHGRSDRLLASHSRTPVITMATSHNMVQLP